MSIDEGAWSISPGLLRPESRGQVQLKSTNPHYAPRIYANMLDDPRDLEALRRGVEIARSIGNSDAMKPFMKREVLPGNLKGKDLDIFIRDSVTSMHHPTSRLHHYLFSAAPPVPKTIQLLYLLRK